MNKIQNVFRFTPGFAVGILLAGFLALAGNIDGSKAMADETDKGVPGEFYYMPLRGESKGGEPWRRVLGHAAYFGTTVIPLNHSVLDWANLTVAHEHYFAKDGSYNVGYDTKGIFNDEPTDRYKDSTFGRTYYSNIIKKAVKKLEKSGEWLPESKGSPSGYSLWFPRHNCQDFATALRDEYKNVEAILKVREQVRQAEAKFLYRLGSNYEDNVRQRIEDIDKIGTSTCSNDFQSKFSKWKAADKKYFTESIRKHPEGWGSTQLGLGGTMSEEERNEYRTRWAEEDKQNLRALDEQIRILAKYFEDYEDGSDWQLWPIPSAITAYRMATGNEKSR